RICSDQHPIPIPSSPPPLNTQKRNKAMSNFQIIRTLEELEALDPDTLVGTHRDIVSTTFGAGHILATAYLEDLMFPMVVVATGDQVRAAREAMEVINE